MSMDMPYPSIFKKHFYAVAVMPPPDLIYKQWQICISINGPFFFFAQ